MPSRRKFLVTGTSSLASLALAGCTDLSGSGSPDGSPTHSQSPSGTPEASPDGTPDSTPDASPPEGEAIRWRADLGGPVQHAPTLADGALYVGGGTNDRGEHPREASYIQPPSSQNLYAYGTDGSERWRYEAGAGVMSSPVRVGGTALAVVGWSAGTHGIENRLVSVADGERRWSGSPVDSFLNVLGTDGEAVFVGTSDDAVGTSGESLFAVSVADGGQRWQVEAGDAHRAAVADGSLYLGYADRVTTALSTADGSTRWQVQHGTVDSVRVFEDALYLDAAEQNASGNYPLVAVDAADGSERWRYENEGGDEGPFVPTAAVEGGAEGLVYGCEYGGQLFALDPADGSEVWRYEPDGETRGGVDVVGDTVYLPTQGDGGGGLHAVDAATGEARWTHSVGDYVWSTYAGESGVVVRAGTRKDRHGLAAFGPDGSERWRFFHAGNLTLPAVDGLRAYVGTESGYLVALGE